MEKQRLLSLIKILATILIVALSLYFSIWKVDAQELGRSFRTANYWLVLLVVPIVIGSHLLRAYRWKVMLRTVYPRIPIQPLFVGVMVGYFMNNVIPRSGELARPYVTAQQYREASFSSLLGTIIVERFIDTIALLMIIAAVLVFDTSLFSGFSNAEVMIRSMLYPAIILGLTFLVIAPSAFAFRVMSAATRPLPMKVRGAILDIFSKLQGGFGSIRTARQIILVIMDTIGIYILYMLPLYVMFFAFPSSHAVTPSLFDATKILAVTALAFAIAPTPGAFGVFHVSARIAVMQLLHFTYADAVAYATLSHFASYATVMILGGYYLIRYNISPKILVQKRGETPSTV